MTIKNWESHHDIAGSWCSHPYQRNLETQGLRLESMEANYCLLIERSKK